MTDNSVYQTVSRMRRAQEANMARWLEWVAVVSELTGRELKARSLKTAHDAWCDGVSPQEFVAVWGLVRLR